MATTYFNILMLIDKFIVSPKPDAKQRPATLRLWLSTLSFYKICLCQGKLIGGQLMWGDTRAPDMEIMTCYTFYTL